MYTLEGIDKKNGIDLLSGDTEKNNKLFCLLIDQTEDFDTFDSSLKYFHSINQTFVLSSIEDTFNPNNAYVEPLSFFYYYYRISNGAYLSFAVYCTYYIYDGLRIIVNLEMQRLKLVDLPQGQNRGGGNKGPGMGSIMRGERAKKKHSTLRYKIWNFVTAFILSFFKVPHLGLIFAFLGTVTRILCFLDPYGVYGIMTYQGWIITNSLSDSGHVISSLCSMIVWNDMIDTVYKSLNMEYKSGSFIQKKIFILFLVVLFTIIGGFDLYMSYFFFIFFYDPLFNMADKPVFSTDDGGYGGISHDAFWKIIRQVTVIFLELFIAVKLLFLQKELTVQIALEDEEEKKLKAANTPPKLTVKNNKISPDDTAPSLLIHSAADKNTKATSSASPEDGRDVGKLSPKETRGKKTESSALKSSREGEGGEEADNNDDVDSFKKNVALNLGKLTRRILYSTVLIVMSSTLLFLYGNQDILPIKWVNAYIFTTFTIVPVGKL